MLRVNGPKLHRQPSLKKEWCQFHPASAGKIYRKFFWIHRPSGDVFVLMNLEIPNKYMNAPTSPVAYIRLRVLHTYSLRNEEDYRRQCLLHVLNSFTCEEWLSLLTMIHADKYRLEVIRGAVYPVPFTTLADLEVLVADARLFEFSRREYVNAKNLLTAVSKNWLKAQGQ